MLLPGRVGRNRHPDDRALLGRGIDLDGAVHGAGTLLERLEHAPAALRRPVVGDHRLDAPVVARRDRHGDPGWRSTAKRLVECLADDLVERHLGALGKLLAGVDVEVDAQPGRDAELLGQRADGRHEALVPEDDRLEREREVAQRADRVALAVDHAREQLLRLVDVPGVERAADGVEHQRDPGERLDRAVVERQREASPLLLLGGDQLVGEAAGVVVQSIMASRSAIATACVCVAASSFVRMWRTWLFTVSWLMKSRSATSAFDMPSARSWRISRSRPVSISVPSRPGRNAVISAGSTNVSPFETFSIARISVSRGASLRM